jgi:hypothetical protein
MAPLLSLLFAPKDVSSYDHIPTHPEGLDTSNTYTTFKACSNLPTTLPTGSYKSWPRTAKASHLLQAPQHLPAHAGTGMGLSYARNIT